jgi:hypothetical protein
MAGYPGKNFILSFSPILSHSGSSAEFRTNLVNAFVSITALREA